MLLRIRVFWDVLLCHWVRVFRRFEKKNIAITFKTSVVSEP